MTKLTAKALRELLGKKSQAELIEDIVSLSSKHDAVREYFAAQMGLPPQADVLDKYKAIITREFSGRGYHVPRLSIARKAVTDYKKIAQSPMPVLDLMLHYVESGVGFTNRFGDIDEPFYNSLESMFSQAMKLIEQYQLHSHFQPRCQQLVRDTRHMGWGFHDALAEMYAETFGQREV